MLLVRIFIAGFKTKTAKLEYETTLAKALELLSQMPVVPFDLLLEDDDSIPEVRRDASCATCGSN